LRVHDNKLGNFLFLKTYSHNFLKLYLVYQDAITVQELNITGVFMWISLQEDTGGWSMPRRAAIMLRRCLLSGMVGCTTSQTTLVMRYVYLNASQMRFWNC